MFGATYTSTRGVLSPSKALRLFKLYMEDTHRIDNDHDVLMELCLDADFALSRIQQSEKKRIASSASNEDKVLCRSIASAYYEITRLFERLGRMNDAQKSDRKAEKWGYIQGSNPISNNNSCGQEYSDISISKMKGLIKVVSTSAIHNIAIIPTGVFDHDVAQVGFKCNLPHPDARLNDTQQLAYCLSLLPTAPQPLKGLTAQEQEWSLARSDDLTEQDRLHSLASDVITMFIHEGIKTEATVAEVVMLAPVLNYDQYRALLMALVNGINQNIMLETHLLQGLAQLMQHVPLGYLDSDDLVNTLNMLDSHLRGTHGQSSDHIYRLCVSVSHVLDAMVNSQVKGLKRGQLHEPLAAYLKGLKNSSDPHLVYHAAYASQALLYIPNDETTMQSMLRRTSAVARGVFGVVSAVKGLDLNAFMDELADIQKKLPSVEDAIGMSRSVCSGVISLYKSGAAFRQSMEEGFSFDSKTAWYPALRGTDTFLQSGELTKFKALACKAPCRQDLAFQWGLCQRLARIAVNSEWAVEVRKDAVSFLGEIYKNDKDWGHHVAVKQWILTILKGLTSLPKEELQAAESLLDDLAIDGDTNKQQMYRDCFSESATQFPFIAALPPPASPSLLDRVQNKPDVEESLRLLKRQRMEAKNERDFYIQQYAKASPQASDEKLFLLMDKVKEFLDSDQKVLLVQGNSGAGKSTFNRTLESTLWEAYQKKYGRIPLFINLPSVDDPTKDMVAKQLRMYDFTDAQIKELKMTRSFILICDGYDETMQTNNLYVTNRLNQPGEWECQLVISCRSEYLGVDYRDRFQPIDRNHQVDAGLFQEAMIVPFSEAQIDDYIKQYVGSMDLMWDIEDYQRALKMVPSLKDLVKNPFILSLSLEVLPRMVDPYQDISKTEIKRVTLYDKFVELWLERSKKRLGEILVSEDKKVFRTLCDEGFAQNGIRYLIELAVAIYKYQDGNPVVDYSPSKHRDTWKEKYFSRESEKNLLREASPLSRTGNQYRFVHRSILEYCLVRAVFEPQEAMNRTVSSREEEVTSTHRRHSISSVFSFEAEENHVTEQEINSTSPDETSPLVWRSFVNEPSILQFLEERAQLEPQFKQQLYEYVELSKSDGKWRVAAANAMTILIRAREQFIQADLRGIQIPGADLDHGIFECAQLQGADLRKASLRSCWFREADLSEAKMSGVQFGEWPLLRERGDVYNGSFSPDGKTLAAAVYDGRTNEGYVSIYDTLTWEKRLALEANVRGYNFKYSPDSQHIAIWHNKNTVTVFDATSGKMIQSLDNHTDIVRHVAYSPSGDRLASACKDGSVHLWDARSGKLQYTLEGHTGGATSVMYSPDGKQIASGGEDKTVQLWDVASGKLILKLQGCGPWIDQIVYSPDSQELIAHGFKAHSLDVWDVRSGQKKKALTHNYDFYGVQYSPDGKLMASFSRREAFQWNMQTGKVIHTLTGHSKFIRNLKYSPSGEQIATCGDDKTVRLWDVRSGQLINTFYGHSSNIWCVAYSPNSHQVASFSEDSTVRLWDAQSRQSSYSSYGHTKLIIHIKLSPDRQHIASCSNDGTVRMWDGGTGQCIHVLQSLALDIKYSPNGQLLASCGRSNDPRVYLWDAQTGQLVHTLESEDRSDGIIAFDFSPIDHQIACGHNKGGVSVWNTRTGQLIYTLQGNGSSVQCMLFSPNGHQVACYNDAKIIRVWRTHSRELLYELTDVRSYLFYFAYSPDSQRIALNSSNKAKLQLRSAETGELCYEMNFKEVQEMVAFSPSSRLMIIGSERGLINVVDAGSGTILHTLEGHTGRIRVMSYSCDGQYIASCSRDKTVRLWDPQTAQCLTVIPFVGGDVLTLAWNVSEEGCFLVTGYHDGSVRMWQIVKKEDGQCHVRLKWSTRQSVLNAADASIRNVTGLCEVNRKLLEQLGAIVDIGRSSISQGISHETKKKTSMEPEVKALDSEALDTNSNRSTSKARPLIAKSEVPKGCQFICNKCSECSECEVAHFIINGSNDCIDSSGQHHREDTMHVDLME